MTKLSFDILSTFDPRGTKKAGENLDKVGKKGKQAGDDVGKGFARGTKRAGQSLDGLEGKAGRAGRKAGEEAGKNFGVGWSKSVKGVRVGGFMKTGMGAAAGLAAGIGFVGAFEESLERGSANAKLRAQLDLSAADSKRLGKLSGDLYASNYGESVSEVSGVVRKVVQDTNTAVKSADLKPITQQVISLANAFEEDFGRVTRGVGQLIRTGLATDAKQGLDIITRGFQKGADKSEDFLDTLNEYGTLFRNLGLSGAQATGILTQGLKAGARDADKVADALKEFSIRAVDGSKLTAEGFKALGLNAETMATKIGKGGRSASEALDLTLDKLRGIKDPVERAKTAVALFGTQAEDLGDALFALDASKAVEELGKVGDAAKDLDKTLGDTAKGAFMSFVRGVEEDFVHTADVITATLDAAISGDEERLRALRNEYGAAARDFVTSMLPGGAITGVIREQEAVADAWGRSVRSAITNLFDWESAVANAPKVVELKGDIKDLDRKIDKAEEEIKDVPPSKRTDFKGDIEDLKRKRRQAQNEINKLQGKTVKIGISSAISGFADAIGNVWSSGSAAGGLIPGPSSNTDNHLRPMATGEFVIRANKVNSRTLPVLEMINEKGLPPQGLAKGGIVSRVNYVGSPGLPQIAAGVRELGSVINETVAKLQARADAFSAGPGRALSFAKAQVGKPYVWGGVGPGGYDCSGFMSAILNVIQGRNPHTRRGTTASFPWSGFSPGMGPFAIGSTRNAGGGIGHMAGSLFGVPVESRGGVGPIVGKGALSATSGMFGGPWHVGKFDRGGQLKPGVTVAVNNTGRNETVLPNSGGATVRLHPDDIRAIATGLSKDLRENGRWLAAVDSGQRANIIGRSGGYQ